MNSGQHSRPRPGDYRISKAPEEDDKYSVWQYTIVGLWKFKRALEPLEASRFVDDLDFLYEDNKYDYWRGQ